MVAVGAVKAMKMPGSNGLFTDFPIARPTNILIGPRLSQCGPWAVQGFPAPFADAAGAEPDGVKRAELLDLCMTCWRQAQMLRRWPGMAARA